MSADNYLSAGRQPASWGAPLLTGSGRSAGGLGAPAPCISGPGAIDRVALLDLEAFAQLGEFLGGAAVLVSLIYLGIQIRQGNRQVEHNTRSLEVSTYRAITSDLNQFRSLLITDPDLGRIYLEGLKDPSRLQPGEQFRFRGLMQTLFANLELMHRVRQARLLELDSHDATLLGVAVMPGARAWWAQARYLYGKEFQHYVDGLVSDHDTEPEPRGDKS